MLLCSALTAPVAWYLFWLSNNIFVWHKSVLNSSITNLFGLIIFVALILVIAKFDLINILLGPRVRSKKMQKPNQPNMDKKIVSKGEPELKSEYIERIVKSTQQSAPLRTINEPKTESKISENYQFEASARKPEKKIKHSSLLGKECDFFSVLQKRDKSTDIPDQCLTCKNLLDCTSKSESV